MAAQDPPDGGRAGPELGGQPDRPPPGRGPQREDLGFAGWAGPVGLGAGAAGAVQQAGWAVAGVAADPAVGGLAGHAELGGHVRDRAILGALDQQQA